MIKKINCPHCGLVNDVHERAEGDEPSPGDLSLCWHCKKPSIFTDAGCLRKPTSEEEKKINKDPGYLISRAAMMEARNPYHAMKMIRGVMGNDGPA